MRVIGGFRGPGRLWPLALLAVLVAGLAGASVVSADNAPAECYASDPSLSGARQAYSDSCSLPRIDCDKIDGTWFCNSRVIGNAAPGGVTADEVGASGIGTIVVTIPPTTPAPPDPPGTAAPSTSPPATDPPVTDPPVTVAPTTAPDTTAAPTTVPSTTAAPTTVPNPGQIGTCGVVALEVENLAINGASKVEQDARASGGRYLTWEGLSPSRNNSSPADVISTSITVDNAGSYRFTWAMRQPDGVDSDKGNDSWLNFPDASRFGPVSGGTYPGFIKVYGKSTGGFAYRATADVNHKKSPIAVEFDKPGTYTMQIAGRSHGHQLDRIVLHLDSIDRSDAIAGRATGCDDQPTPTTPETTSSTTTSPTVAPPAGDCQPNRSGTVNLSRDLISLQYDHAPDRDDAHAAAAGKEVATSIGFTPWVIGGAYGADNRRSYQSRIEPVMDAIWGSNGWTNADADWEAAVRRSADRWQQTWTACGDIWIAEGGQSDLSADIVRELKRRVPGLETTARIHLVQHSNWNEEKALDADLAYVKANTDYIRIPDGNGGGNGSADFND